MSIEDSLAQRVGDGIIINGSSANAVMNNYTLEIRRNNHTWLDQSMFCNHGPHAIMNMFEGNITARWQNDGYHGSSSHTVLFRNSINGLGTLAPSARRIVDLCRGSYYHSVVGNVIGDPSWNPSEYDYHPGDPVVSCIYILGFPGMDSVTMDAYTSVPWAGWTKSTSTPDADVAATLLRHGNFDYYNDNVVWDDDISFRIIPDSLVYTTKPDYFGSLLWPPIGPDVSGLVNDIPAKARWEAYVISGNLDDLFRD